MRRFFQALLIVMFALRGLMGDAMALGHAGIGGSTGHMHAEPVVQSPASHARARSGYTAAENLANGHDRHADAGSAEHSCCPQTQAVCSLCPVCHSMFHAQMALPERIDAARLSPVRASASHWIDAELTPPAEPPRSTV